MRTTVSVIKADVGSVVGHHRLHQEMLNYAVSKLREAEETGLLCSGYVTHCGDEIILIMTQTKGENNPEIHGLA